MRLTARQAKRFYGILEPLRQFADTRFELGETLTMPDGRADEGAQSRVLEALWNDPSVIDDFAAENPAKLSPADIACVVSWKGALHGTFVAFRSPGHKALFQKGNHLFEVTGLAQQISELLTEEISFVTTALLPFEGRIVYSGVLVQIPMEIGAGMRSILKTELLEKQRGPIMRSADDLLHTSFLLRETGIQRKDER